MAVSKNPLRDAVQVWHRRRRDASSPIRWNGPALAVALRAEVGEADRAGLLDPSLLDPFEADLVTAIERAFAEHLSGARDAIGGRLAEMVFGETDYTNGLDKQLAIASAAVAEVVLEEDLGSRRR